MTNKQAIKRFKGITEMTLELATAIYESFGSCTALYECHSPKELVEDFNDLRADDSIWADVAKGPEVDVAYWLDIQLGVEDAFGTGSELISQVRRRLSVVDIPQAQTEQLSPRVLGLIEDARFLKRSKF